MDPAFEKLHSVAIESIDPIWFRFAKEGRESAVFAPMSKYPEASAWLARSFALTNDYIVRKLGAMLAGWIQHPKGLDLLSEMLKRERIVFRNDPLVGNSVGEDIMFAATRWTESQDARVKEAGIFILSSMISDALTGTPWNTANWAAANLFTATKGSHEILKDLANATSSQMEGQPALMKVAEAIRQNDREKLDRYFTPPSEQSVLAEDDPEYPMAASLWAATKAAEAVI